MLSVSLPNVGCWSALLLWSSRQALGQAGCNPSAWRPVSCCFSACPLGVSAGLCCFALTHWADHRSAVCQVLLCSLILAVYWVLTFFSSPQNPKHFHFLLLLYINSSLSSCHLSPHSPLFHLYFSDTTFVMSTQRPNLVFAVLWRSTEANRTDGLRWFPGSAHFYRKQPGIATGMMLFQGVCRSKVFTVPFLL